MSKTESIPKVERVISLLLYLAGKEVPATHADIERNVEGYDGLSTGDGGALKALDRDIASLRDLSVHIVRTSAETFSLDDEGTFSKGITVDHADMATLALASMAALGDPEFPFADDLRRACVKIQCCSLADASASTLPFGPLPKASNQMLQRRVSKLEECRISRKRISFTYTKPDGTSSTRNVKPAGLFSIQGDFYLIALDENVGAAREFRVDRMSEIKEKSTSAEPDFDPLDIDIRDFLDFPFAFGNEEPFDVVFLIPKGSRRAPKRLWERRAVLFPIEGQAEWELMLASARDARSAARWAIDHSPDTIPLAPDSVVRAFREGLEGLAGSNAGDAPTMGDADTETDEPTMGNAAARGTAEGKEADHGQA